VNSRSRGAQAEHSDAEHRKESLPLRSCPLTTLRSEALAPVGLRRCAERA